MQNYHLRQIFRCFTLKQLQIFLFLCLFNVFTDVGIIVYHVDSACS